MPSLLSDRRSALAAPELPFVPRLVRDWRLRKRMADAAYVTLMTLLWLAGNLLAVLGLVVVAFVMISEADFYAFMSHLDNLASRFVAADPARRATFEGQVWWVLGIMTLVFVAVRLPRFVTRLRADLLQGPR